MSTPTVDRDLALCGHQDCPSWVDRNSVLDEPGDVVLFTDCDGVKHLFRDGHPDGLILDSTGDGWTLTRNRRDPTTGRFEPDAAPVCDIFEYRSRGDYGAHHRTSGRVVARGAGWYGLLAKAARFYLHVSTTVGTE
jgi:hypothetical protein